MAIFLLELPGARTKRNGIGSMIVEANTEAVARRIAQNHSYGDGDWEDASCIATSIAAGLAPNYQGCVYRVRVENPDGSVIHDVQYTALNETASLVAAALAKLLRGKPMAAVILDDGGVKTDDTAAANEDTTNDVDLTPATPNSGDAIMFGFASVFGRLFFDVSTAGVGTYTVAWEYWDGSAWQALSGVTDSTTSFKTNALNRVIWTIPANWQKKSETGFPDLFYVRAKLDAGTVTTAPKATRVWAGPGYHATNSANTLNVSAASDNVGDKVVHAQSALPGQEGLVSYPGGSNDPLINSKTDQGAAGNALILVLKDVGTIPTVFRSFGLKQN